MDLPSITIVTPSLNVAATLPATLASVASQDYPGMQHVVVDGGSTDGTLDILAATQGIEWTSEPDRGLSDAVNKGVARATGDVVGWLNGDDVLLPGALDRVGRAFAEHPEAEWATGRCLIIDGAGDEIRRPVTRYKDFLLRRYSLGRYLTHNFVSAPATYARREALLAVGPLREEHRLAMDYDLWLRLASRGDPVFVDAPLAAFRMAEGSLSMSGFSDQLAEAERIARAHADGRRAPLAAHAVLRRSISLTYRAMRAVRSRRG